MTLMQLLLIINGPQIIIAVSGVLTTLGVGKALRGKVQKGNEMTDNLTNSVESRLIDKESRIRDLMAENASLRAKYENR